MTTGAEYWPDAPSFAREYLAELWYNEQFPSDTRWACDHLSNHGIDYVEFIDKYRRRHQFHVRHVDCMMDRELSNAFHDELANKLIDLGLSKIRCELQDGNRQWAKLQRAIFVEVYNQGKPEHLRLKE